jgi:cob(I)alamin adenosyltransferase
MTKPVPCVTVKERRRKSQRRPKAFPKLVHSNANIGHQTPYLRALCRTCEKVSHHFEVIAMRLYTKRGDKGLTDLMGGRVKKNHPRVVAYGTIDELNSVLGMVRALLDDKQLANEVKKVQRDLFVLGSELATAEGARPPLKLSTARLKALERQIDKFQTEAPTPKLFVFPGGSLAASFIHFARTVCRRAERCVVALSEREPVRPLVIRYLNRLSDWLFALALVVNKRMGISETTWQGRRGRKMSNRR